ncbi:hypothetical protein DCAR_0104185 [Daucus carota subsp. sativus]|uniref:Uncharacterized protein n=1 Tax=Daucus carota subsp. sativus TaxID=79200 RepID=A0A166IM57_DAUCS|nr:hypothetical protein DCAR_0104185 [Daucus carota subsp. sativus]
MYVIACLLDCSLAQQVHKDDLVTDLLVLPPGTDLHDHHFVKNGIILQGKASSMVAVALDLRPGSLRKQNCSSGYLNERGGEDNFL